MKDVGFPGKLGGSGRQRNEYQESSATDHKSRKHRDTP
jgi:hypothetical protein